MFRSRAQLVICSDGINGSQRVGEMDQRNKPCTVVQEPRELIEIKLPVLGEGDSTENGPGLLTQQLPGHDIRVVLHPGDEHLVT